MAHITANVMAQQHVGFNTHRVQLNSHTSTVVPLELQHLGVEQEYKEIIDMAVRDVSGGRSCANGCLLVSVIAFMVIPVVVFTTAGPGSSRLYMIIPPCLFVLILFSMGIRIYAEKKVIEKMQRRIDEINSKPNLTGKVQFSFQSETWGRRHVQYFLEVQYRADLAHIAVAPVAGYPQQGVPVGVAVHPAYNGAGYPQQGAGYPQHQGAGYPQHQGAGHQQGQPQGAVNVTYYNQPPVPQSSNPMNHATAPPMPGQNCAAVV